MMSLKKGFILTMGGLATIGASTIPLFGPLLGYAALTGTMVLLDSEGKHEKLDRESREGLANWYAAEIGLAEYGFKGDDYLPEPSTIGWRQEEATEQF
jgi:hypothetical protein